MSNLNTGIVLNFANYLRNPSTSPEVFAKERGWLDDQGNPTADGRELVEALSGQDGTRSAFRNVS